MVWARLDDAMLDNPKIAEAGIFGFALHVAAITWCCRNLTDGFVPRARVRSLLDFSGVMWDLENPCGLGGEDEATGGRHGADAIAIAEHLEGLGLWREDLDRNGYWLKDFLEYNPSKEKVLAERARKAKPPSRSPSASLPPETPRQPTRKIQGTSDGPVPVPDPLPPPPLSPDREWGG